MSGDGLLHKTTVLRSIYLFSNTKKYVAEYPLLAGVSLLRKNAVMCVAGLPLLARGSAATRYHDFVQHLFANAQKYVAEKPLLAGVSLLRKNAVVCSRTTPACQGVGC